MKNIYIFVLFLAQISLNAQIVNIPNAQFKAKLLSSNQWNFIAQDLNGSWTVIDTNNDGQIQVSEALNISSLTLNQTQITDVTGIKSFANLTSITIQGNNLDELDVSNMIKLKSLYLGNNTLDVINTQGCTVLEDVSLSSNAGYVTNLSFLQNLPIKKLRIINNNYLASADISTLTTLEDLTVSGTSYVNPNFTSLNLSTNVNLKKVVIEKPNLTSLTLNPLSNLQEFTLQKTPLTSLNLSSAGLLTYLFIQDNVLLSSLNIQNCNSLDNLQLINSPQLTNVNIQNKPSLTSMSLGNTGISSINFTGTPNIINLSLGQNNSLTSVDLSPITGLKALNFNENNVSTLDLSQNHLLQAASAGGTNLTHVNVKNGNPATAFYVSPVAYMPNLQYICCETGSIPQISAYLISQGHTNVEVNSYCSFAPGGTIYTVQGNTKYDSNNNGCDANDVSKAFQQFNIVNGSNSGNYVANASGNYNISVLSGTSTITPIVENPAYFTISPTNITANFPTQTSPLNQNFCITANGTHNDLETVIIPLTQARPGFNAKYKIVYKNKGTTTQSGTLTFNYDDAISDYLSATTAPSSQTTGVANWNFTNLQPFETKEITVTVKLNTPTQTPPVNGGDVLHYTAQISGATDDTPLDNTFALNQTVVNSFDPNDKTCLEGTSITQTKVGDYVHYLIRFENTGTANAQNIVVKDEIDISKYDVSSLIPLNGSHNFVTRVTGNVVEFIFENIQLPFDDANNDGYISFKIKTKSTLNIGDSFSNTAKIYFDYNHPIITNTYITTVQNVLATSEIGKENNTISIYPNPVQDVLNIQSKNEIVKAEIYDVNERILNTTSVKGNTINVSELIKGNYIIKLSTKDKTFTQKFIKN